MGPRYLLSPVLALGFQSESSYQPRLTAVSHRASAARARFGDCGRNQSSAARTHARTHTHTHTPPYVYICPPTRPPTQTAAAVDPIPLEDACEEALQRVLRLFDDGEVVNALHAKIQEGRCKSSKAGLERSP